MPNNLPQKLATPHTIPRTGARKASGVQLYSVQHRVEHALAEVFHGAETNVGCGTVYGTEDEDRNTHKGGGENHGEFAADMRCPVQKVNRGLLWCQGGRCRYSCRCSGWRGG